MSDSNIRMSDTEIHERVLRTALARDRAAEGAMDAETLAKIASRAYEKATQRDESLEREESAALAALAGASIDSSRIYRSALVGIDRSMQDADRRRGFFSDLLFPLLPVPCAVAAVWIYVSYGGFAADLFSVIVLSGFGLAALAALAIVFFSWRRERSLAHWVRAPLVQSGGAIAAGFALLVCFSVIGYGEVERRQERERYAELLKWNQALAVAVAGTKAGASLAATQSAMEKVTDADWIRLEDAPESPGCWLAHAGESGTRGILQANTCPVTGLVQVMNFKSRDAGKKDFWFEYLSGKVVKTDLNTVTLQLGNDRERIISLPDNTLAPPENSEVVAALPKDGNKAFFLQPIDAVVAALKP